MIEAPPGSDPTRSDSPVLANPTLADPLLARAIDTRRAELRAKTDFSQARVLVATPPAWQRPRPSGRPA